MGFPQHPTQGNPGGNFFYIATADVRVTATKPCLFNVLLFKFVKFYLCETQYGALLNSFKAPGIRSDALVVDDNLLLSVIQGEQLINLVTFDTLLSNVLPVPSEQMTMFLAIR